MPKDTRLYAKFCVDILDHPKFVGLSDGAFRTWFDMVLWSRRHLTDGFIPGHMVVAEPNGKQRASWLLEFASELLRCDVKNPLLSTCENGYQLHDFAQHQTTKSDIDDIRAARVEAGRRGGIASGEARRKQTGSKLLRSKRSKTKPETETETLATYATPNGVAPVTTPSASPNGDTSGVGVARADAPTPTGASAGPTPCPTHGENYDHDEPCSRCAAFRRWEHTHPEQAQRRRYLEHAHTDIARRRATVDAHIRAQTAIIDQCPHCDDRALRHDNGQPCYDHQRLDCEYSLNQGTLKEAWMK